MIALPQPRQFPRHEMIPTSLEGLPQQVQCVRRLSPIRKRRVVNSQHGPRKRTAGYYPPETLSLVAPTAYGCPDGSRPALDRMEELT